MVDPLGIRKKPLTRPGQPRIGRNMLNIFKAILPKRIRQERKKEEEMDRLIATFLHEEELRALQDQRLQKELALESFLDKWMERLKTENPDEIFPTK